MSTYNQLIHEYRRLFNEKGLSPETVKAFLFELCNEYGINMYLDLDKETDQRIRKRFDEGISKLLDGAPLNYVLGYSYFYGYKMIVNEDVLIPRPETEELVSLILSGYDVFFKGQKIKVCDIGTGSGAIAIALKKEENSLDVYASDISAKALEVARKNAVNNDCEITFLEGSMTEPYLKKGLKFDILVSNPPYIKTVETIESAVYDYEPHIALFGGEDGLKYYRMIFEDADKLMNKGGIMYFEMGYDLGESLSSLAKACFPKGKAEIFKDICGKERMLRILL